MKNLLCIISLFLVSCAQVTASVDTLCMSTDFDENSIDRIDVSGVNIEVINNETIYTIFLSRVEDISEEVSDILDVVDDADTDVDISAHLNYITLTPDIFNHNVVSLVIKGFDMSDNVFFEVTSNDFEYNDTFVFINLNNMNVPVDVLREGPFRLEVALQSCVPEIPDTFTLEMCFDIEASGNFSL